MALLFSLCGKWLYAGKSSLRCLGRDRSFAYPPRCAHVRFLSFMIDSGMLVCPSVGLDGVLGAFSLGVDSRSLISFSGKPVRAVRASSRSP